MATDVKVSLSDEFPVQFLLHMIAAAQGRFLHWNLGKFWPRDRGKEHIHRFSIAKLHREL